jgi:hypothetical protein
MNYVRSSLHILGPGCTTGFYVQKHLAHLGDQFLGDPQAWVVTTARVQETLFLRLFLGVWDL